MGHKDCVKNKDLVHSARGSICLFLPISFLFLECALWTCRLNISLRKQTTSENSIRVLLDIAVTKLQSKGFDPIISSVKCKSANHYTMEPSVMGIIF